MKFPKIKLSKKINLPLSKKFNISRNVVYVFISILIIGVVLSLGIYIGYYHRSDIDKVTSVSNKEPQINSTADFSAFWKAWNVYK
jgi:uncharacterized membrane protein